MNINVDAILIDDDPLVHALWEYLAIKHNKNITMFKTPEQFFLVCNNLPAETPIYIDSNLANGVKGEVVSEKIYLSGFRNIYLATGDSSYQFKKTYWLKDVISKYPPWHKNDKF